MLMDIIDIGLFNQNKSIGCFQSLTQVCIDITSIDLFDQNVGIAYAKVRLKCSWISLKFIYLIKI